jgi:iron(II)-dependent oxidoreductase
MSRDAARAPVEELFSDLAEARTRTLELIDDLNDEQMIGPSLAIVNPLRWEVGHDAWFQEFWVLRHFRGRPPILEHGDRLYDSARIAHDARWGLPLPSKAETLAYMRQVLERILEGSPQSPRTAGGRDESYFLRLALFHEYMHAEAITYTRQTLAYEPPRLAVAEASKPATHAGGVSPGNSPFLAPATFPARGDAFVPGGVFLLGSMPGSGFVFDNEEWAHPVEVKPFAIARTQVTNGEFAAFVADGGYSRRELWSDAGWQWRSGAEAEHPVYWRRDGSGGWLRRNFNAWVPLEERHPVLHVNWYEAEAYCRWAKRQLPTEAEWELAASGQPAAEGHDLNRRKRQYPWGDDAPTPVHANLDWRRMGCIEAAALPAGDSPFGCRQMIGNTWEWTASDFEAYPGFQPGPYKEYSAPWFGTHKVLRGGCWATRSGLIRNNYRNFYTPDRRDVWAGFRTCASEDAP